MRRVLDTRQQWRQVKGLIFLSLIGELLQQVWIHFLHVLQLQHNNLQSNLFTLDAVDNILRIFLAALSWLAIPYFVEKIIVYFSASFVKPWSTVPTLNLMGVPNKLTLTWLTIQWGGLYQTIWNYMLSTSWPIVYGHL